jgi:hypothetical protein
MRQGYCEGIKSRQSVWLSSSQIGSSNPIIEAQIMYIGNPSDAVTRSV